MAQSEVTFESFSSGLNRPIKSEWYFIRLISSENNSELQPGKHQQTVEMIITAAALISTLLYVMHSLVLLNVGNLQLTVEKQLNSHVLNFKPKNVWHFGFFFLLCTCSLVLHQLFPVESRFYLLVIIRVYFCFSWF